MNSNLDLFSGYSIAQIQFEQSVMMIVGALLLYLAIRREFEPLLLVPIGFGCVLANIPGAGQHSTDLGNLEFASFVSEPLARCRVVKNHYWCL